MPTTVTHSIGTASRDYSTVQLWLDAAPDLVAGDKIWRGEGYNDSEFSGAWDATAVVQDATRYVELTTAAGQSFYDNASVRANALRYSVSNGVGSNRSTTYSTAFNGTGIKLSRWQLTQGGTGGFGFLPDARDLLVDTASIGPSFSGNIFAYNILIIQRSTTANGCTMDSNYVGSAFCTLTAVVVVVPSNISNSGIGFAVSRAGPGHRLISCGAFGFGNSASDTAGFHSTNSKNNATDKPSGATGMPGTSPQHSVTYSSVTPFTQASAAGNLDFRSIAATALAGNGFLDATNAPLDIGGFSRANPSTIGHWEIAPAATLAFPFPPPGAAIAHMLVR